jgi:hypothetical protein
MLNFNWSRADKAGDVSSNNFYVDRPLIIEIVGLTEQSRGGIAANNIRERQ